VKRREFIGGLGAAVWPLSALAQQPMPIVGYLRSEPFDSNSAHMIAGFRDGLKEAGYVDGQNVAIEFRTAEGRLDRLPALAAELIDRRVSVIVGNNLAARAAKRATATVPIVFVFGGDPVATGFVASLNKPGANLTGITFLTGGLGGKRLDFLSELVPKATLLALLADPANVSVDEELKTAQEAAGVRKLPFVVANARNEREIDAAFAMFAQRRSSALVVGGGAFFARQRNQIVSLAARHHLPASYLNREDVQAGGLMSYGTSQREAYRQAGVYAARIVKGEKPADLPVLQPTKFELVINLKTAKALNLSVPNTLLVAAEEVIE
jgi:putative ABC transport system substrate-binding protein